MQSVIDSTRRSATLGALLQERGEAIGVLFVGGASLLLLGVVERPTADVNVIGVSSGAGYSRADVLPGFLTRAVREVGDALGFNTGPAGLIEFGLPPTRRPPSWASCNASSAFSA